MTSGTYLSAERKEERINLSHGICLHNFLDIDKIVQLFMICYEVTGWFLGLLRGPPPPRKTRTIQPKRYSKEGTKYIKKSDISLPHTPAPPTTRPIAPSSTLKLRFFPAPLHIIHIEPEGEKRVQNEWMNITKRWSGPPTERPGPVTFFTQKSGGKKAKEHVNGRIERGTKK